jgi:hypothetical protein
MLKLPAILDGVVPGHVDIVVDVDLSAIVMELVDSRPAPRS